MAALPSMHVGWSGAAVRQLIAITVACLLMASATVPIVSAQAPDRSMPPAPGPPPALTLPAVQKRQLSNGIPVWIVELHEVPVVQVNLVVFSGTSDDPVGKFGVASLTAAMLTEGAGSRSSLELADAIDFLGADLGATSGIDSSAVRLHVPVARLPEALNLMADVALRPTFPREELGRQRQQRLTGLLQARDDAATIAALAFSRVLYGPTHRYGTATMGTAETIRAFGVDDLRSFYQSAYRPDNATLLVVGDVSPDAVLRQLESAFGGWKAPAGGPARTTLPAVSQPKTRTVYLLDKPGAPQSQIRIGWLGVPRSTPDYFPLQVLNTVLGGAFSSRLNLNLREEHGYTYGAASSFDMRATAGPFAALAGVQTDKTKESLQEFFKELNGILQPIPADELARAKNYVALRFPGGFETTGDISRRLEEVLTYHLPDDYFSNYVQRIEAVTAADVQRVAKQYIDPARLAVVVVGDLKAIDAGVKSLNLGPIRTLTIDEVFGPAP
ncbi:MAG: M16 family metallopeptidase [Vicinamibacterales bacterium]